MQGVPAPEDLTWLVVLAGAAMVYMAWGIGANDVANAFGPAFGARSLTISQACMIAAVCEASGAILMGSSVSDTIRKGMMSIKLYSGDDGRVLILVGMTAVLIGAATWLLVASKFGLPVSTTHSAVGGVIAIAVISKGYASVKWTKVGMIIASWFISPAMSCLAAFCIYMIIKKCVLGHSDSMRRAKLSAPIFVFVVTFVVALFTMYKGGKGLGLHKTSIGVAIGISATISLVAALAAYPFVSWWARKIMEKEGQAVPAELKGKLEESGKGSSSDNLNVPASSADPKEIKAEGDIVVDVDANQDKGEIAIDLDVKEQVQPKEEKLEEKQQEDSEKVVYSPTEQLFTGPVVIIAGFFSLAHGANDVANSVGPFGAVLAAFDGPLEKKTEIPLWVFVVAGISIVIGLATFGIHVMQTIGNKITPITPPKAFVVNFAATLVVLIATKAGIPISTTHASVGAVVGVGLADGAGNVSWKMMTKVFLSWILTLPIVGISAAGIFAMLLPCVVDVPFETVK